MVGFFSQWPSLSHAVRKQTAPPLRTFPSTGPLVAPLCGITLAASPQVYASLFSGESLQSMKDSELEVSPCRA